MIDKPYCFLHGDKTYILNSKEKKLFVLWINNKPSKIIKGNEQNGELPKSNWENLRNMWNNYYPQAKITCSMPNYNLLEKDYKKVLTNFLKDVIIINIKLINYTIFLKYRKLKIF